MFINKDTKINVYTPGKPLSSLRVSPFSEEKACEKFVFTGLCGGIKVDVSLVDKFSMESTVSFEEKLKESVSASISIFWNKE